MVMQRGNCGVVVTHDSAEQTELSAEVIAAGVLDSAVCAAAEVASQSQCLWLSSCSPLHDVHRYHCSCSSSEQNQGGAVPLSIPAVLAVVVQ